MAVKNLEELAQKLYESANSVWDTEMVDWTKMPQEDKNKWIVYARDVEILVVDRL